MSLSAALAHVGGDQGLLDELLAIFAEECPRLMRELSAAVAASDAGRVHCAAHTLRGELQVLGAGPGAALARQVEAHGRAGRLDGLAEVCGALEAEVARVFDQLNRDAQGTP